MAKGGGGAGINRFPWITPFMHVTLLAHIHNDGCIRKELTKIYEMPTHFTLGSQEKWYTHTHTREPEKTRQWKWVHHRDMHAYRKNMWRNLLNDEEMNRKMKWYTEHSSFRSELINWFYIRVFGYSSIKSSFFLLSRYKSILTVCRTIQFYSWS